MSFFVFRAQGSTGARELADALQQDGVADGRAAEIGVPGSFYLPRSKVQAHDHVVFWLQMLNGETARIVYNDPRRFGFMLLLPIPKLNEDPHFRDLGVEPFDPAFKANFLARAFSGRKAPVKALLLDQRLIAGLGNIYVCEALHRSGVSPKRAGASLVRANGGATAALARE